MTAEVGIRQTARRKTRLRVYDGEKLLAAREITSADAGSTTYASISPRATRARASCASRSIRWKASATPSTTRARTSWMCRRPGATFFTSRASRAGNTSSSAVPRSGRSLRLASVVRATPNRYYRQGVRRRGAGRGLSKRSGRAVRIRRRRHRQLRGGERSAPTSTNTQGVRGPSRRRRADARRARRPVGRRLAGAAVAQTLPAHCRAQTRRHSCAAP